MKNISTRLDHDKLRFFWCTIILLTAISFGSTLLAGQDGVSKPLPKLLNPHSEFLNPKSANSNPLNPQSVIPNPKFEKAEVIQKTQRLQMPFIANEGQTDEKVAFYANTFGGTVFVAKDGDIVYSLSTVAPASSLVHNELKSGAEYGNSLTLDTRGSVYLTGGGTYASNFPMMSGVYDASQNGNIDVFVSKRDSNLSASVTTTPTNFISSQFSIIDHHMTSISPDEFYGEYNGCKTPPNKSTFLDTDTQAALWFNYENATIGDTHKSEWYAPDGTLYLSSDATNPFTDGCNYSSISIKDSSAASKLGKWQVKKYRNDQHLFTETFTISSQFSIIDHHMTSISPDEFYGEYKGCKTPPNKSAFLDTDTRAALWFNYENATIGDTHKSEWYAPDGILYSSGDATYSFTDGCWYRYISIKDSSAASKLGKWQVKVYRNDQHLFIETFTIQRDSTEPTPSPTPSPTPTPATGSVPSVTTKAATNVTSSSVTLNGTVNANGLSTTGWFEYGKSSGSYSSKSSTQNVSGSNNTTVSIGVSGLSAGTTYYYRLVAQSSAGTTTGTEMFFSTQTSTKSPIVTTGSSTNVTSNSATLNGTVNANGLSTTAWFEYDKNRGSYSSKSSTQNVSGSNNTPVSMGISGLLSGITYYYRLAAQNSAGITYGSERTFTTEETLLEKYAPILYMHGQERFHPTNVKVMLDNSELYKKKIGKDEIVYENEDNTLTLEMLMSDKYNTKKHYLKLKKDAEEVAKDKDIYWYWKKEQTVYGRQFPSKEDKTKTVLQYWFFYVYNDWGTPLYSGNSHEGDWEMIQIILNNNKNDQPERITYGFHHGGQTFELDREEVSKNGNHPLVYVTLGGHGCWNISGNNAWYQVIEECRECIDETSDDGDVLYPSTMSNSEIQAIADKYSYKLEDLSNASTSNWIYWKGYWGNQEDPKDIIITDFGSSGPPSPPYIDYIKKSKYPRWKFPVKWADFPLPSNYTVCASDNSKVIISDLEDNSVSYNEYCSADSNRCGKECSNLKITYSEKDLIFDIYSLDGKEVDLKISRHKRKGEIYEVEFNSLEIPRNGKASFTFSPDQNPDLEIGIDHDMDGLFDSHRLPDYFEIK